MFKPSNKDTRHQSSVSFVNFEQVNAGWAALFLVLQQNPLSP